MSLPTRDQELRALALSIERQHGADGPRVLAEKIGAFALAGESGAVELWREIARRYDELISLGAVSKLTVIGPGADWQLLGEWALKRTLVAEPLGVNERVSVFSNKLSLSFPQEWRR